MLDVISVLGMCYYSRYFIVYGVCVGGWPCEIIKMVMLLFEYYSYGEDVRAVVYLDLYYAVLYALTLFI